MSTDNLSDSVVVTLRTHREIVIAKSADGWPRYVHVEVRPAPGVGGDPVIFARWAFGTPAARLALARETALSPAEISELDLRAGAFVSERTAKKEHASEPSAHDWGLLDVECWSDAARDQRKNYPVKNIDEFIGLLEQPQGPGVYLKWSRKDEDILTLLDCDFHHRGLVPSLAEMEMLMSTLAPAPVILNTTTRGFHALYAPYDGLTARDLASAATAMLLMSPTVIAYKGTVEILHRTRHPKSDHHGKIYGPLRRIQPSADIPILSIFDRISCTETERQEIIDHTGLRPGQRLPHSACPIDPNHASTSTSPVVITDHGVLCYSCEGRLGSGFVSWGALRRKHGLPTQATGDTQIMRDAIDHWAPHAHVSRLFEALAPHLDRRFHKSLHRCLLLRRHADVGDGREDMIRAVFNEFPYVRNAEGMWCHADTLSPTAPRLGRTALSSCSFVKRPDVDDDGIVSLRAVPDLLNLVETDGVVRGLYPLTATVVSPVWHLHHQATTTGSLVVQPRNTLTDPLRYLPAAERLSFSAAKSAIEARFPGIDWGYLTLLHCARGWGEEGKSQLPMIWATGETGSGKTSHIDIEAALHDETPARLLIPHDRLEDLNEEVAAAQRRNGFLLLDDFCKNFEGKIGRMRLDNTIAFLLRAGRSINYHAMFIGEKVMHITTPIVMTDMRHPAELVQNEQVGRRIVMVQLHRQMQWDASKGFRDWWRKELRQAAESWHSWVVDTYFGPEKPVPFFEIAKQLGYQTLREMYGQQDESHVRLELVRELIQHMLKKPEASGNVGGTRDQTTEQMAVRRSRGPGWVILDGRSPGPFEEAAQTLCHALNYETITVEGLKKALEQYQTRLHEILPFNEPIRIDIEGYRQNAVLMRLRALKRSKPLRIGLHTLAPGATPQNMLDPQWAFTPDPAPVALPVVDPLNHTFHTMAGSAA